MKTLEATVKSIESYEKYVVIECNPFKYLTLKKSHSNFIDLYNKLRIGKTFFFEYKNPKILSTYHDIIIDIMKPLINIVIDSVDGFLNITNEYPKVKSHPYELKFSGKHKNKRLLVTQEQRDIIDKDKVYKFTFQKAFGENLYEILNFELTFDYSNGFYSNGFYCYDLQ